MFVLSDLYNLSARRVLTHRCRTLSASIWNSGAMLALEGALIPQLCTVSVYTSVPVYLHAFTFRYLSGLINHIDCIGSWNAR